MQKQKKILDCPPPAILDLDLVLKGVHLRSIEIRSEFPGQEKKTNNLQAPAHVC